MSMIDRNAFQRSGKSVFAVIEVMVTLLIVSFGLLGLAGLLFSSINAGKVSMSRSVAVSLANDMADRIRANWKGVRAGAYDNVTTATSSGSAACDVTCMSSQCTPANQAALDVCLWKKQVQKQLPGGQASITVDPSNVSCLQPGLACAYTVSVFWTESLYQTAATTNQALFSTGTNQYDLRVQP